MEERVFVGTYTQELSFVNGKAKGIELFNFSPFEGKLAHVQTINSGCNPSYLKFNQLNKTLIAVNEEEPNGAVEVFHYDGTHFIQIAKESSDGAAPCYLTYNTFQNKLLIANYSSGSFLSIPINTHFSFHHNNENENFFISSKKLHIQHDMNGCFSNNESSLSSSFSASKYPHYLRQISPHCHHILCIQKNFNDEYVFVCDLGKNEVLVYLHRSSRDENLNIIEYITSLEVPKGNGPRHLVFHPEFHHLYVINELSGTLSVFQLNSTLFQNNNNNHNNNNFEEIEDLRSQFNNYETCEFPILPCDWNSEYSAAAIRFTRDFQYLIVSIRVHDSISVFQVNQNIHSLRFIQNCYSGGQFPRDFNIHPSNRWLLVANQNSSNIVVFEVLPQPDDQNELLKSYQSFECPTPVCIEFS